MKVKCNNDIDFPFQTKMSTTSQKHRNFVAEPMNEKPVTDLAGIGEVLGKRLESKGFDKAYVVLGQVITQVILLDCIPLNGRWVSFTGLPLIQ